jgi:hypothetical protein
MQSQEVRLKIKGWKIPKWFGVFPEAALAKALENISTSQEGVNKSSAFPYGPELVQINALFSNLAGCIQMPALPL